MQAAPRPISADPRRWAKFRGVKKVSIEDMPAIFPGYSPLEQIHLSIPVVPAPAAISLTELSVLISIVRATHAASYAQIGTYDGLTIRNLLDNCPDLQSVVTVDLPEAVHATGGAGSVYPTDIFNSYMLDANFIGHQFRGHSRAGIVRDIRKDSALLTPEDFPVRPEVFFIDGNHVYDYCVSDTRMAHRVLARPGVLIWHNFGNVGDLPGVTRALTEVADDPAYSLYWLNGQTNTSFVFGIQNPA
jgi:hypothetical protein